MGASCYLCETGITERIPNTDAGDAVGVCKVCSVLACLGHGFRDENYPRWICVICDASLLTVAAVQQSRDSATRDGLLQGVSDELKEAAKSVRSSDGRPPQRNETSWWWLAESAREWMQSFDSLRDDRWQGVWRSLTPGTHAFGLRLCDR